MEWADRQLAEIQSLQAMYTEEGELRVDEEALAALQQWVEEGGDPLPLPRSLSVSIRVHQIVSAAVVDLRLSAVLPHFYPSKDSEVPSVWLDIELSSLDGFGDDVATMSELAEDEEFRLRLQERAVELACAGEECLVELIQCAKELVLARLDDIALAMRLSQDEERGATNRGEDDDDDFTVDDAMLAYDLSFAEHGASLAPQLGRRAMFSHHIIASSKRDAISRWATQLHLGGLAKIGWPGVIIVEGDERNVRAYVEALSRLRWKHFVVRAEQVLEGVPGQSVDDLRALPCTFEEFGTDAMSAFAARCREHGVEELFLRCLKIGERGSSSCSGGKRAAGERAVALRNGGKRK